MSARTPLQRAKAILDICAWELKNLSIGDMMTLEAAIQSEIEAAERVVMREINHGRVPEHMANEIQDPRVRLVPVRKREKK